MTITLQQSGGAWEGTFTHPSGKKSTVRGDDPTALVGVLVRSNAQLFGVEIVWANDPEVLIEGGLVRDLRRLVGEGR